jgi:hypothetical protein
MLDALSHEAGEITALGKRIAVDSHELLARSAALSQQIDVLIAGGERLVGGDAEMISSFATVDEFAAFQARHFPFKAIQPKVSAGSDPAAQDDGQGIQGSAEAKAAPTADEAEVSSGEAEQVVAEKASGERFVGRDEPEADPDFPTIKDRFLDLWAETLHGGTAICRILNCPQASGVNYLVQARRDGDARAAKGDLARTEAAAKEEEEAAASVKPEPYSPPVADVDVPKDTKPGQVLALDLATRDVSLDGKTICVPRHDLRMLIALNDGMPTGLEPMLTAASVAQRRRLDTMVKSLSERLDVIGVEIEISEGPLYTLKHL